MCAFVPLKPNELRPGDPRPLGDGSRRPGVRDRHRQLDSTAMCGFGSLKCRWGGISRCCSASTTLMSAGDAGGGLEVADVRLDGADEQRVVRRARPWPSTAPSAWTSMGSPSDVPVPWAST